MKALTGNVHYDIWNDPISGKIGGKIQKFVNISGGIAPIDVKDLACPTWGLGYSTYDGTVITTIGPPYLPIVIPPTSIFSLDPTWALACTAMYTHILGKSGLAIVELPIALTPAAVLLPPPTVPPTLAKSTIVAIPALPSIKPAKPASIPNDFVAPAKTQDPGKYSPTPLPVITSAGPASLLDKSAGRPNDKDDPPPDPPLDPKVPSLSVVAGDPPPDRPSDFEADAGDPPAGSVASLSSANDSPMADSRQPPTGPKKSIFPSLDQGGNSPQTHTQGLGAIIYNAFGKPGPKVGGSPTPLSPLRSVFTIDTQTFTANPTGFKINNAAITPGGTAHLIDGTTISLDQSGILALESSTISLTRPLFTALATEEFTVAGQIFTPNPSAFSIAGTTISVNRPAATLGGTIISLAYDGVLRVGSSTISLLSPSNTPSDRVYTVAGQPFTPNPSAFSIAGTTISAGGPAATVSGTLISLQPSGTLIIGSSTISLTIPPQSPSEITIDGFDIKAHSSFIVVDGTKLSATDTGATVSGEFISLEAGGKTLDIGTGHFVLPTQGAGNGSSVGVQAFMGGQDGKRVKISSFTFVCMVCGIVVLLV